MAQIEYGDILLNEDFEIFATSDGDLSSGSNKEHQIGAIVNADTGNFRKHPTMAANLSVSVEGVNDSRDIVAKIINASRLDGWRIDELNIETQNDDLDITVVKAEKITDNTSSLV